MEESWFEQTAICIKGEQPCLDQGGYLRVSSHSWLTVILICILSIHVLFPFFLRRRERLKPRGGPHPEEATSLLQG